MFKFFETHKQREWVWILGMLIVLTIPATIPFWQSNFFMSADSPLHLWRVYELDRALRAGTVYPRWAPDLYFGYSYPLFNFYPPLAYYMVETLHVIGIDIANAFKLDFALTTLLAGGGMLLLSRDVHKQWLTEKWQANAAGIVSAVAFAYAPYFLIDIYIRGAIAETLGLAFLPLYFWSLRRMLGSTSVANVVLAGVVGALLLLSHNLTAFFAAPVIVGYVLIRLVGLRSNQLRVIALGRASAAAGLALALSAFYWLPAVVELRMVYIGQPALSQAALRQTLLEHFKTLQNVIQLQFLYSYPLGAFPLGGVWVGLALVGLVGGLIWLKRGGRLELIYFAIVAFIAGFALIDVTRPIWLSLPALWVIQFTWRLTVFVSLGGALAVGGWVMLVTSLTRQRYAYIAAALALLVVLIVTATWNLRAEDWFVNLPSASNPEVLARYETDFRETGMSSQNEYLPVWTKYIPDPSTRKIRAFPNNDPLLTNPPPLDIQLTKVEPNAWNMRVNAPQPTPLTIRTFYYPDWYAWIDNQPVPTRSSTNLGLLTVDAPQGEHQVRLVHGSLPVRDIADDLTLLGLLCVGGWTFVSWRRGAKQWHLPIAVLGATLFVFAFPQVRTLTAQTPQVTTTNVAVGNDLRLVGWTTERPSPSVLKLHLYWNVQKMILASQATSIQLIDAQGKVWSSRSQLPRYGVGDERYWIPNEIVEDWYDLYLPDDLPAGQFTLQIERGDKVFAEIGNVQLERGPMASTLPPISQQLDARLGDSIQLLGFDSPPLARFRAQDLIPLTLYWRTNRDLMEDFTVFVHLLDKDLKLAAQQDSLSNNGFLPTMLWAPGAVISDHHTLVLPADIHPGRYQLVTGLYRFRDLTRLPVSTSQGPSDDDFVPLGEITIPADVPFTPQQRLQYKIGAAIELRGMTLDTIDKNGQVLNTATGNLPEALTTSSHDNLHLTLEWFGQQPIPKEYTVYTHLVDTNGKLVKQQDNPPVHGYYPTTIWTAGERVVDEYQLELKGLAVGEYTLLVGMYESDTQARLPVTTAGGVELPNSEIPVAHITLAK